MNSTFKTAAMLSGLIYEPWPAVELGLASMNMGLAAEPFDIEGTQGMLVVGITQGAFLVFRGTEATGLKWRDIWSNFGVPSEWDGIGYAHSGYAKHLSYVRKPARAFAEKIPTPIPLYITGHSLGGVVATLYASWVGSGGPDDHKIKSLITFGAPKGLSLSAIGSINCPVYRFVNKYDFAPHWPFITGLSHPELCVRVNSGGWPGPVSRHSVTKYISTVS